VRSMKRRPAAGLVFEGAGPCAIYGSQGHRWRRASQRARRVIQQNNAGSDLTHVGLDAAGNATTTLTPRGSSIVATYDALNRVTQRVVPEVSFGESDCHTSQNQLTCHLTFPTVGEDPAALHGQWAPHVGAAVHSELSRPGAVHVRWR
jgi:hypothetical protein